MVDSLVLWIWWYESPYCREKSMFLVIINCVYLCFHFFCLNDQWWDELWHRTWQVNFFSQVSCRTFSTQSHLYHINGGFFLLELFLFELCDVGFWFFNTYNVILFIRKLIKTFFILHEQFITGIQRNNWPEGSTICILIWNFSVYIHYTRYSSSTVFWKMCCITWMLKKKTRIFFFTKKCFPVAPRYR